MIVAQQLVYLSILLFPRYFDCVDIGKIYDHWIEVRVEGSFPNSASAPLRGFHLTVFDRTEFEFSIFQQISR